MVTPQNRFGEASALLTEMADVMKLAGENVFKVRAFEKAADLLSDITPWMEQLEGGKLTDIPGIGKGIAEFLTEFFNTGESQILINAKKALPEGLVELSQVSGLGPKKAMQLIQELEIKTLGELEYACRENRLVKLKGFGQKLQDKILEGAVFLQSSQGQMRLDEAFVEWARIYPAVAGALKGHVFTEVGKLGRRHEIVDQFEVLIAASDAESSKLKKAILSLEADLKPKLKLVPHFVAPEYFGYESLEKTASPEAWTALGSPRRVAARTSGEAWAAMKRDPIPPECLETEWSVQLPKGGILSGNEVQGVFHVHTTRSDGIHTLEEMVVEAKRLGLKYLGISDHSQSAFYAQGLKPEDVRAQRKEFDEVQSRHPEIKLFYGIESDILADGSLDYDEKILKLFDFVIASIHSRFQMDAETMTNRILAAIENPYTTMLGHLTGRLLLGRKAYGLDMERIIAAAARHRVIIEINAHPARLDLDWRFGPMVRKYGALVSINPDAHEKAGLMHTDYGILVARKALLDQSQVFNTKNAQAAEEWLHARVK